MLKSTYRGSSKSVYGCFARFLVADWFREPSKKSWHTRLSGAYMLRQQLCRTKQRRVQLLTLSRRPRVLLAVTLSSTDIYDTLHLCKYLVQSAGLNRQHVRVISVVPGKTERPHLRRSEPSSAEDARSSKRCQCSSG